MQDAVLLVHCKEQMLLEKGATARVLEPLTEINKRRLWVQEGYASLFDFDDEPKALLEATRKIAGEKNPVLLLKKV